MFVEERKRVLVVDDEPKIAKLLKSYLESSGYEVETAGCGEEGLDSAKEHKPDLVVLDLKLPDISGYEVSDRLRQVYSHEALPILMLTAMDRPDDRERGFEHGADAYIAKPFDFSAVAQQVGLLLSDPGPTLA